MTSIANIDRAYFAWWRYQTYRVLCWRLGVVERFIERGL